MGYICAIFVAEGCKLGSQVSAPEHKSVAMWHAIRSDSFSPTVGLVLISAVTLFMTQTHRFVCVSCVDRGLFVAPYPILRAVRTHIGKSPVCLAAGLGVKEVELETRPTDAMVGCTGAAGPAQDLQHQCPSPIRRMFCKKRRTKDILDINK